jgi:LAS superfamily LD-carboxypeptidase LdcB
VAGDIVLAQRAQESVPEVDTGGDPSAAMLLPVDVPGIGRTYFDPEVAPRVNDFIDRTQQAGIDIQFASGFRSTGRQKALLTDPTATTPATPGNSLHEAGRAFDITINNDDGTPRFSEEQLRQIVDFGR